MALDGTARPRAIVSHMANQSPVVDATFAALADPTRRAVLEALRDGSRTVSQLASGHEMALPSFLKHLRVLEDAGLIATRKIGRVRSCEFLPHGMTAADDWMRSQREFWESAADRLAARLEEDA